MEDFTPGGILAGIVAAAIFGLCLFLWRNAHKKFLASLKPYRGFFYCYHVSKSGDDIVRWDSEITYSFPNYSLKMIERNEAAYAYSGKVTVVNGVLYSSLKGQTHEAMAFVVGKLPFNTGNSVSGFFALLTGVNQDRNPATVQILFSRHAMLDNQVSKEFEKQATSILIKKLPSVEQARHHGGASRRIDLEE